MFISPLFINPLMNTIGKVNIEGKFLFSAIGLFALSIIALAGRKKFQVKPRGGDTV